MEVAKSLLAAFADRDQGAAAEVVHPEVEIRPAIVGGLEGIIYRGLDGTIQFWADIDAAWSEFGSKPRSSATSATRSWCLDEPSPVQRQAASSSMSRRDGVVIHDGQIVRFRVQQSAGSPRSRWAVGVGDVAGEPGDRSTLL